MNCETRGCELMFFYSLNAGSYAMALTMTGSGWAEVMKKAARAGCADRQPTAATNKP
jgi:hypothetical protein